ncbi:MAG: hypothetical protein K6F57_01220 [Candidatus Saccharibacteria bacterium]|nr:hypothetical protein [Candidatus Saccharibacteria bacterium]
MPEKDKELEVKHHGKECRCAHNDTALLVAFIVVSVLLVISAGFNIYFAVSRGNDARRFDSNSRMMRQGRDNMRQRGDNNQDGNSRKEIRDKDGKDDKGDKDGEQNNEQEKNN